MSSLVTTRPSETVQQLVEEVRYPGATALVAAHAAGEVSEEEMHGDDDDPPAGRHRPRPDGE